MTILRLLELRRGTIRIDGIDISYLSRQSIRHSLTTLPQDPVTMTGTVRKNLDPEGHLAADSPDLETVLTKVGIWSIVSMRGGIDTDYRSMGFSAGQKQLFCLARALLHKSKLILLDEATSSVDKDTDLMIRGLMRKEFLDSTVIEVVHRLETIVDYDVLVVMKDGEIAEVGTPRKLLTGTTAPMGES